MKSETNRRDPLLVLGLVTICSVVGVFIWLIQRHFITADQWPLDKAKLSILMNAVYAYCADYGDLPSEREFKTLLLEHDLVTDDTLFHSSISGLQFRYYAREDHFVLVGPGADGSYETPEGYDSIEASENRGDDVVRFGKVPRATAEN